MEQMTFLDFFAGIGGFRKGFELCGMRCVGHCEIDKYADRSYRAIHDVKEDEWYGEDITKTDPADLRESISGQADSRVRTFLYLAGNEGLQASEALSFLKSLAPQRHACRRSTEWLVLENVKNLLSVNRGWDFATVLHSLAEIGYHIEYGLLTAWS